MACEMECRTEEERITSKNHGPKIKPTQLVEKKRTFYWLDGTRQVLDGDSVADAMITGGYTAGALHALDFVANGDCDDYIWIGQHWIKKTEAKIRDHI